MQGSGVDFLQGEWIQDSIPYKEQLLEYTRHKFVFTCDSFYVQFETHAKVNHYQDSCFSNGSWIEYAKGTYLQRNDTIYLDGTFTKANYKQKISGCHRIGRYLPVWIVKKRTGNSLELKDLNQHAPLFLTLRKRITCIPKPL